jgi:hypothetical protein
MSRRDREMRRLAAEFGCTVTLTNGGHIRFTKPGAQPVYAAATPSCWRARRNLEALLRRHSRLAARV